MNLRRYCYAFFQKKKVKKMCLIMRLSFILMIIGVLQVSATSFAQNKSFSIAEKNMKLAQLFDEIEQQGDYKFFYNNDEIDVSLEVEINVSKENIFGVLDQALDGSPYNYKVLENNLILVHTKTEALVASQQGEVVVKGTVTDDKGEPLPGVNVFEKSNPTNGVITGIDGGYSIKLSGEDAVLSFSFIGFNAQEITVAGRREINITLVEETLEMDEVVVVGYGTQRKEALTSSVSTVGKKKIEAVTVTSVEKALQGNTAGVLVTNAVGQPGGFASVTIRGVGSINASSSPLYVVDGVPVISGSATSFSTSSNFLSSLNPADIETMTVMKDAAATAIYGARASNGVVLITTKQGKEGKTQINFNMELGFSDMTQTNVRMTNSDELLELQRESVENAREYFGSDEYDWTGPNGDYYLPDELANSSTDWYDEVTQLGKFESYNLSARGGNEKTNFFVSGSWFDQEGTIICTGFQRFSARLNLEHKLNDWLSFGINTTVSATDQDYSSDGYAYENPIYASSNIVPYVGPYNEDGSYNWDLMGSVGNYNPVANLNLHKRNSDVNSLMNTSFLKIQILPELSFKTTLGIDYKDVRDHEYITPQTLFGQELDGGVTEKVKEYYNWTSSNILTYNKIFADVHSLDVLGGYELNSYKSDYVYASGGGANDDIPNLSGVSKNQSVGGNASDYSGISMFTRANYSYNGRYYVSGSLRRDGSSRFGPNNKWALFGSASLGWAISREEFFNVSFINNLKLRASYGTTGNSSIGYYSYYGLYGSSIYNSNGGLRPDQIANPDLQWESAETSNLALDFGFFNRINGTVEYFWRKSTDMLINEELSLTTGQSSILRNLGSMMNQGLEFQVSTQNIKGEFSWITDFNISFPKSEFLDLGGMDYIPNGGLQRRVVGGSWSDWYMADYAGVDPGTGLAMYYDENGNITHDSNEANKRICGSPEPDFYGGLSNTFLYKGIELDFMFQFNYGNEVMFNERSSTEHDGSRVFNANVNDNQLDRWQQPGDITSVPMPIYNNDTNSNLWNSDRYLEDGSYLRLKSVSLSYNLPKKWLAKVRVGNLKVFTKGTNLWTLSSVNGFDPEVNSAGYASFNYPVSRTIVFGVNVAL
ncbi:SusC/RagA family TonB-linked outer membrane protein [Marinilabiliaceae bacterium JC017]|nr:SusC/RagA family TonB-linked outer membrane protein [Marinilabiliaceae bacterium JC017]